MASASISIKHNFDEHVAYAGDKIKGVVTLTVTKGLTMKYLMLRLKGKEKTRMSWSSSSTNQTTQINSTSHNSAKESHKFLDQEFTLKTFSGGKVYPGTYRYPFTLKLPTGLPSSVHEDVQSGQSLCKICYHLKLDLREKLVFDPNTTYKAKSELEVRTSPRNITSGVPVHIPPETSLVTYCGCIKRGSVTLGCTVDSNMFDGGQVAKIGYNVKNESALKFKKVNASLHETISFSSLGRTAAFHGKVCDVDADMSKLKGISPIDLKASIVEAFGPDTSSSKDVEYVMNMEVDPYARDSYEGKLIKVSHHIEVVVILDTSCIANPLAHMPIYIVHKTDEAKKKDEENENVRRERNSLSSSDMPSELSDWTDETARDSTLSYDPAPIQDDGKVSYDAIYKEMDVAFDDYSVIEKYSENENYLTLLQNCPTNVYSKLVNETSFNPDKIRVAAFLAECMGDKFTCSHVAAILPYVGTFERVEFVKKLATMTSDVAKNSGLIRTQLNNYERNECVFVLS